MSTAWSRFLWIPMVVAMVAGGQAAAQDRRFPGHAFQARVGGFFPSGDSDFWVETAETFTLDIADQNGFVVGLSFVTPLGRFAEVGFNWDYYGRTVQSSYRDYVDAGGFPILHDSELREMPLTVDFRLVPTGNVAPGPRAYRRPAFYVGGGVGALHWSYEETGDFLDFGFDPPEIFPDRFRDQGWAPEVHALAGLELPLGPTGSLLLEGRYLWAEQDLGNDFAGLGTLDLGGLAVFVGGSWRF